MRRKNNIPDEIIPQQRNKEYWEDAAAKDVSGHRRGLLNHKGQHKY